MALSIAATAPGCGQDVGSCDSICGLPDAPGSCKSSCETAQESCTAAGDLGDFQAWVTCVNNCGSYLVVSGTCAAQEAAMHANCGAAAQSTDGGTTGTKTTDSGTEAGSIHIFDAAHAG
jgi:hypothetical protein